MISWAKVEEIGQTNKREAHRNVRFAAREPMRLVARGRMVLEARGRTVNFPRRPLIMGILNINDDSFSGDGRLDVEWAARRARELVEAGADIIDVGAESARTNRAVISVDEEIARFLPFVENFSANVATAIPRDAEQLFPPLLSVNTWRSEVAKVVLPVGGDILNDMGALPTDENARIAARTGAALLIMHSVGEPKVPQTQARYEDVMTELMDFFSRKMEMARAAGLAEEAILLDPGIDFAKQRDDNLRLLARAEELQRLGRPVLLPISRKTVIGDVLELKDPNERDAGTLACLVAGVLRGAQIFRVHHVSAVYPALKALRNTLALD